MLIDCNIKHQTLSSNFRERLVANSVNYLQIQSNFIIEKDWENLFIYAEFSYDNKNYLVEITDGYQGKIFNVPAPVIKAPGFGLSFFGTEVAYNGEDSSIRKRITTNVLGFKVMPSGDIFGNFLDIDSGRVETWSKADQALKIAEETEKKINPLVEKVNKLLKDFQDNLPKINAAATLRDEFDEYKEQMKLTISNLVQTIYLSSEENKQYSKQLLESYDTRTITPIRTDIQSIKNHLNKIYKLIDEIQENINDLKNRQSNSENKINELEKLTATHSENITDLFSQTEDIRTTITSITENIQTIFNTLEEHDSRFNQVENRISILESKKIEENDTTFAYSYSIKLNENKNYGTLNLETGELEESENKFVSDFILVYPENDYCVNNKDCNICFYTKQNEEYIFVSSLSLVYPTNVFKVPAGVNYLRVNWNTIDNLVLEKGNKFDFDYEKSAFNNKLTNYIKQVAGEKFEEEIAATLRQYY